MQSNYVKSNSITEIDFSISSNAHSLVEQLLKSKNNRQKLSSELLDELADLAKIDIANVKVSEAKQYHKKYKGKIVARQYAYYRPKSRYIYINNRTAVRGQILASKTFVDTLLHEWVHHYDYCKLGLNSIHTSGFYARLKDLKTKLGYFRKI